MINFSTEPKEYTNPETKELSELYLRIHGIENQEDQYQNRCFNIIKEGRTIILEILFRKCDTWIDQEIVLSSSLKVRLAKCSRENIHILTVQLQNEPKVNNISSFLYACIVSFFSLFLFQL